MKQCCVFVMRRRLFHSLAAASQMLHFCCWQEWQKGLSQEWPRGSKRQCPAHRDPSGPRGDWASDSCATGSSCSFVRVWGQGLLHMMLRLLTCLLLTSLCLISSLRHFSPLSLFVISLQWLLSLLPLIFISFHFSLFSSFSFPISLAFPLAFCRTTLTTFPLSDHFHKGWITAALFAWPFVWPRVISHSLGRSAEEGDLPWLPLHSLGRDRSLQKVTRILRVLKDLLKTDLLPLSARHTNILTYELWIGGQKLFSTNPALAQSFVTSDGWGVQICVYPLWATLPSPVPDFCLHPDGQHKSCLQHGGSLAVRALQQLSATQKSCLCATDKAFGPTSISQASVFAPVPFFALNRNVM